MSNVTDLPMSWATAMRLVAVEIGVPPATFDGWLAHALTLSPGEDRKWLSDQMYKAARKKLMRGDSPL